MAQFGPIKPQPISPTGLGLIPNLDIGSQIEHDWRQNITPKTGAGSSMPTPTPLTKTADIKTTLTTPNIQPKKIPISTTDGTFGLKTTSSLSTPDMSYAEDPIVKFQRNLPEAKALLNKQGYSDTDAMAILQKKLDQMKSGGLKTPTIEKAPEKSILGKIGEAITPNIQSQSGLGVTDILKRGIESTGQAATDIYGKGKDIYGKAVEPTVKKIQEDASKIGRGARNIVDGKGNVYSNTLDIMEGSLGAGFQIAMPWQTALFNAVAADEQGGKMLSKIMEPLEVAGHYINKIPLLSHFRNNLPTEEEKKRFDAFIGNVLTFGLVEGYKGYKAAKEFSKPKEINISFDESGKPKVTINENLKKQMFELDKAGNILMDEFGQPKIKPLTGIPAIAKKLSDLSKGKQVSYKVGETPIQEHGIAPKGPTFKEGEPRPYNPRVEAMNEQRTFTPEEPVVKKGNIDYAVEDQSKWIYQEPKKTGVVGKVADATVQTLNRMNPTKITKFVQMTGKQPGEWLRERDIVDTPDGTVEKLVQRYQETKAEADKGLDAIEGGHKYRTTEIEAEDGTRAAYPGDAMRDMLDESIDFAKQTSSPQLGKLESYGMKYDAGMLSMKEINDVKRFFERNNKFTYNKDPSSAVKANKATNIDNAVREWQMQVAEENGLLNLRDINRETQAARHLADNIADKQLRMAGNNMISLTDYVTGAVGAAHGGIPGILMDLGVKKILTSDKAKAKYAKVLNKISPREKVVTPKADIEGIKAKQAEKAEIKVKQTVKAKQETEVKKTSTALPAPSGKPTVRPQTVKGAEGKLEKTGPSVVDVSPAKKSITQSVAKPEITPRSKIVQPTTKAKLENKREGIEKAEAKAKEDYRIQEVAQGLKKANSNRLGSGAMDIGNRLYLDMKMKKINYDMAEKAVRVAEKGEKYEVESFQEGLDRAISRLDQEGYIFDQDGFAVKSEPKTELKKDVKPVEIIDKTEIKKDIKPKEGLEVIDKTETPKKDTKKYQVTSNIHNQDKIYIEERPEDEIGLNIVNIRRPGFVPDVGQIKYSKKPDGEIFIHGGHSEVGKGYYITAIEQLLLKHPEIKRISGGTSPFVFNKIWKIHGREEKIIRGNYYTTQTREQFFNNLEKLKKEFPIEDTKKAQKSGKYQAEIAKKWGKEAGIPETDINTAINEIKGKNPEVKIEIRKDLYSDDGQKVNGYYDPETDTIFLDEQGVVKTTAWHETGHRQLQIIKEQNPKMFERIEEAAKEQYKDMGPDWEEPLMEDIHYYAENGKFRKGNYINAIKEFIKNLVNKVKGLVGKDDPIRTFFNDVLNGKIKGKPESAVGKKLQEQMSFNFDEPVKLKEIQIKEIPNLAKIRDITKQEYINNYVLPISEKHGITPETTDFIIKHLDFGSSEAKLTPEIERELSKYKPDKPVVLYRGEKEGKDYNGRQISSWSYERGVGLDYAGFLEREGDKLYKATIDPKDIIMDTTKMPSELLKDIERKINISFIQDKEILVRKSDKYLIQETKQERIQSEIQSMKDYAKRKGTKSKEDLEWLYKDLFDDLGIDFDKVFREEILGIKSPKKVDLGKKSVKGIKSKK